MFAVQHAAAAAATRSSVNIIQNLATLFPVHFLAMNLVAFGSKVYKQNREPKKKKNTNKKQKTKRTHKRKRIFYSHFTTVSWSNVTGMEP